MCYIVLLTVHTGTYLLYKSVYMHVKLLFQYNVSSLFYNSDEAKLSRVIFDDYIFNEIGIFKKNQTSRQNKLSNFT